MRLVGYTQEKTQYALSPRSVYFILIESQNESYQIRHLLDLLVYEYTQSQGESITHNDLKTDHLASKAFRADRSSSELSFWSNNRAVNTILEAVHTNPYWVNTPRYRALRFELRFPDTDSLDWSPTAQQVIDMATQGRVWIYDGGTGVDEFEGDIRYYIDVEGVYRIRFID